MRAERAVMLLIGLIGGLLLMCSCAGVYLATGDGSGTGVEAAAPTAAAIEADLSEQYINRVFLANTSTYDSPMPITGGQIDVQPGNVLAFSVDLDSPVGPLTATGSVTMTAVDGLLDIRVQQVTVGRLPVTRLMRLFRPDLEADINAMANRQLLERASQVKLKLDAVTTDDTTLRVYLSTAG